jgi:hypothetical protein
MQALTHSAGPSARRGRGKTALSICCNLGDRLARANVPSRAESLRRWMGCQHYFPRVRHPMVVLSRPVQYGSRH